MGTQVRLPQSVVDVSVFIEGNGFAGLTDKISLPDIERILETSKAGGFERDVDTGVFKKMEFEVGVKEFNKIIYTAASTGIASGKGIGIVLKGSILQDGTKIPFVATIQGKSGVALGGIGAGDGGTTTLKGTAERFSYELNGEELVHMDTRNMIAKIAGVDHLEVLRQHIL
ncbi:MAG TPA: hypothetical protein CFH81_00450 [Sulfurovum sp. UBA12169]|nr:MAG TPA: hypothetical protein CFH81_00450 [Sulfurovum sp. UBA12169]